MSALTDILDKDWDKRTSLENCVVIALKSGYLNAPAAADQLNAIQEKIDEYTEVFNRVMAEQCAPDEQHCTCVPSLRKANVELANLNADLQENIKQARQHLKQIQWNGESGGWLACPSCHKLKKDGHSKDCELVKMAGLSA